MWTLTKDGRQVRKGRECTALRVQVFHDQKGDSKAFRQLPFPQRLEEAEKSERGLETTSPGLCLRLPHKTRGYSWSLTHCSQYLN